MKNSGEKWTTKDREHTQRKKTALALVIRMDHEQALYWEAPSFEGEPGRPRTDWRGTVKEGLQRLGLTWEMVDTVALNRRMVSECVSVCSHGRGLNHGQDMYSE